MPAAEDELSANVDELRREVRELRDWLGPLHRELTDLDDTAEALEKGLAALHSEIGLPGL